MKKTQRATFTVLFYLKKNNPKADGTIPIMGRITINGKSFAFSTKLSIPSQLKLENNRIVGKTNEAKQINNKLIAIESRISDIYDDIIKYEGFVSVDKVKKKFLGKENTGYTLLTCYKELMKDFEVKVEKGLRAEKTYTLHITGHCHLKNFIKEKYKREDIELIELDKKFIDEYYYYLRITNNINHNSIYNYMGVLLRTINKAIDEELILVNPFKHYKNNLIMKDRGYLLKEEIEKIIAYTPPKDLSNKKRKTTELVKDLFLFSCFTGFAYIDIQQLKKEHIQSFFDGHQWIIKRRQKSKVPCNVRLLSIPQMIINKYEGLAKNDYLFPMPFNSTCNNYIKLIMRDCGIQREKSITFHWARHSFATLMLTEDIPIETISKMMGHKKIETTQIYAKITSKKISQDMEMAAQRLQSLSAKFIQ